MLSRVVSLVAAAAVFTLSSSALAQDAGTGGTGGSAANPDCTIDNQSESGSTCQYCVVNSSDTSCQLQLGDDYNFVCDHTSTQQVWCNGPDRSANPTTDATSCALRAGPVGASGFGLAVAAAALAVAARRRRARVGGDSQTPGSAARAS